MTDSPQSLSVFSTQSLVPAPAQQAIDYWIDGWQRTILFLSLIHI